SLYGGSVIHAIAAILIAESNQTIAVAPHRAGKLLLRRGRPGPQTRILAFQESGPSSEIGGDGGWTRSIGVHGLTPGPPVLGGERQSSPGWSIQPEQTFNSPAFKNDKSYRIIFAPERKERPQGNSGNWDRPRSAEQGFLKRKKRDSIPSAFNLTKL